MYACKLLCRLTNISINKPFQAVMVRFVLIMINVQKKTPSTFRITVALTGCTIKQVSNMAAGLHLNCLLVTSLTQLYVTTGLLR